MGPRLRPAACALKCNDTAYDPACKQTAGAKGRAATGHPHLPDLCTITALDFATAFACVLPKQRSFEELGEDKVLTKWRFSCVLELPWRPLLAAAGEPSFRPQWPESLTHAWEST